MNKITQFFSSLWSKIWKIIEFPYFFLISSSWFIQLPNKTVIMLEVYYISISAAIFFGTWGVGNDASKDQDFSLSYYILLTPFLILWLLKAITIFGYKARKAVKDYYWETQLMRFLDPTYSIPRSLYPNLEDRIVVLKKMWELKYDVTIEWTRANEPSVIKTRILLMLGAAFLGLAFGYYF